LVDNIRSHNQFLWGVFSCWLVFNNVVLEDFVGYPEILSQFQWCGCINMGDSID